MENGGKVERDVPGAPVRVRGGSGGPAPTGERSPRGEKRRQAAALQKVILFYRWPALSSTRKLAMRGKPRTWQPSWRSQLAVAWLEFSKRW